MTEILVIIGILVVAGIITYKTKKKKETTSKTTKEVDFPSSPTEITVFTKGGEKMIDITSFQFNEPAILNEEKPKSVIKKQTKSVPKKKPTTKKVSKKKNGK